MRWRTIVLVVAMLLSTPVFAPTQSQAQPQTREDRTSAAAIRERYERVARHYRQRTLGRKWGSMDHPLRAPQKKRVQELIERAEVGETVTTDEVDFALGLTP